MMSASSRRQSHFGSLVFNPGRSHNVMFWRDQDFLFGKVGCEWELVAL